MNRKDLFGIPAPTKEFSLLRWDANYSGYGSVNTTIGYWPPPTEQYGSAFRILTNNGVLGLQIQILEPGLYFVNTSSRQSNLASFKIGISLNSTQLTTSIESVNSINRIARASSGTTGATSGSGDASALVPMYPGDIIRPHSDGQAANSWDVFSITKVN